MINPFFIVALPRSRTAWLANLFNTESVFCYHDVLAAHTGEGLKTLLGGTLYREYVGVADTSPVHAIGLKHLFPESRIVVVKRDPLEVLESMANAFFDILALPGGRRWFERFLEAGVEALDFIEKTKADLTVKYEDLSKIEVVREVWGTCCPDVAFDENRAKFLENLKITVNYSTFAGAIGYMKHQKELLH